ncbi:MAG: hypothetical protein HC822_26155 [Oscillochloris sp.]|nr:hypothetical protein [Oscillochloris sp.]
MDNEQLFLNIAQQSGYPTAAALAALERVRAELRAAKLYRTRYYLYRTGGAGSDLAATSRTPASPMRPRTLLAFLSADAALAFAQHRNLGKSPQLITLSLGQILATLINRPTIGAALIAAEAEHNERPGSLPHGMPISREHVLDMLTDTIS